MRPTSALGKIILLTAAFACSEDTTSGTSSSTSSGTGGSSASSGTGGSSSGTGGSSSGTGGSSTSSGTGGSSSGTGGSSTSSGTGGGGGGCGSDCQTAGLTCCNGVCVNLLNDINNCGTCGKSCPGQFPFCDGGNCGPAPCDPGTNCIGTMHCCGTQCCAMDQLCCVMYGGPQSPPQCTAPNDQGTCDPGCPVCP